MVSGALRLARCLEGVLNMPGNKQTAPSNATDEVRLRTGARRYRQRYRSVGLCQHGACHEPLPFDVHTPARGISGNLARKMPREVQLEDGAAPLSLEHGLSTPGCPLCCGGSSTPATSAWVLMPAHGRLRPPAAAPRHHGVGWRQTRGL